MKIISGDEKDNKPSISLLGRVFLVIAGSLMGIFVVFAAVYLITIASVAYGAPNPPYLLFLGYIPIVVATISWIAILLTAFSGKFNRVWLHSLVISIVLYGVIFVAIITTYYD